ncbi:type II CRISPR RNA-guided endonuclease Cas9 [Lutibacter sp. A80]|uniref:type II CRISPR RNA-guided endonuclease Cas9 n=1 Tax=Lutibacter sp. A80 TaxID=2918453 RepID=UPI001F06B8E6|nr:type II CRISPR RNA-guided endonuclease Cas9 [Lutibacter sp. A80]UMB59232.1 type II CRISPR RNA-guided endonuclease Cas9 [Lutibacter sp. A80]
MKKILGLDLGTASIGWALVKEAEVLTEKSEIIKLGVRVNPLTTDELTDFEKGRPLSVNADRTLKRGARRNLQRFKLRRKNLIEILCKYDLISKDTPLTEIGKETTHQTLALRAKAAKEKIDLDEFARVLLTINKKRGYKSSRKAVSEDEGVAVDGMAVAKELYENNLTPGEYVFALLKKDKKFIPDFYRSDLQEEFNKIWETQKQHYPSILSDELFLELQGKNKGATWKICEIPFNIVGIKLDGTAKEQKLKKYQLRAESLQSKISLEHLAIVLQEINNELNKSSGYLGAISDRSKELYFNKLTVGEYLYKQIKENPHTSLKNQVFYRQDYLDEFEQIWEVQARYHSILTADLKEEIRDIIIFYQRKLKSQKGLLSFCQFESKEQEYIDALTGKTKKRTIGPKVISKSSPLFQEFKIWQNLNNLEFKPKKNLENNKEKFVLDEETNQLLFEELNIRGDLKANEVLKFLGKKPSEWKCNFEKIEGNRTNQALYNVYQQICEIEGYGFDWNKKTAIEIKDELKVVFPQIGIKSTILDFDTTVEGIDFDKQDSYQLWHLLYAAEDDGKISEADKIVYGNLNVNLKKKLHLKYGFKPEYAKLLSSISLQQDYSSLSTKAIRKILPYLQNGNEFSEACKLAGYNHSNSLTKDELAKRTLKDTLELLPKNSLRNPVVEKILNQMVNLINQVIERYGKPDEVRIELARELKKSAKERAEMTSFISKATTANIDIKKTITKEYGIPNPTKNDVIRYKLWQELAPLGYKTIFTGKEISPQQLFSKEIDIEHIIPKALLFDDSFSNKTLAFKKINLQKRDRTALDFIEEDFNDQVDNFKSRVETLFNKGKGLISNGKYKKMLMSKENLPDGFIERDLRNSQYIAKKARTMLLDVFPNVVATTGGITNKLREDWGLINIMKELNLPKYKALGLTDIEIRKNNKEVEVIKDWTKRNDHRHHAMDALTVAFTSHNHIQYINNLSARKNKKNEKHTSILGIERLITFKENGGKRKFKAPIENFREEAKKHIESILISFKTKNKVVTRNVNKIKQGKNSVLEKIQLTPRGQLHKETVYGKLNEPIVKLEKVNAKFTPKKINEITKPIYREALLNRLSKFGNNPKKAFTGKNSLTKNPIYLNAAKTKLVPEVVKTKSFNTNYTIRKEVNPDNFKNVKSLQKIIDVGVRRILEKRLKEFDNKPKEAFSNLEKNPIWLNKNKTIAIKRVAISGVKNAEPLHAKKDHLGNKILIKNKEQAIDFVSTGNNHHVAIYKDEKGKLQEKVVSFYEAVARVNEDLPIIDKHYNEALGWQFLFTMKQNELFVFPSDDFNPYDKDLLDIKNASLISKYLFRVQKIATKDYFFRHHLETTVQDVKELKEIVYKRTGLSGIEGVIKVRTNHLGEIVQVGEYD